jgi:hypothetical protein
MRTNATLIALGLVLTSACGGLDNRPFETGVIRGQVVGAEANALVAVVGHEELVTSLDPEGFFELRGVPLGPQELIVIATLRQALRFTVQVGGANVVQLGVVQTKPTVHFEVYVRAPGGQRVAGTVFLDGTPISGAIRGFESEAEFNLPAGCYDVRAVAAGLGEERLSLCIPDDALVIERTLTMPVPDGSPGREGCVVSGCQGALMCAADLSCE